MGFRDFSFLRNVFATSLFKEFWELLVPQTTVPYSRQVWAKKSQSLVKFAEKLLKISRTLIDSNGIFFDVFQQY